MVVLWSAGSHQQCCPADQLAFSTLWIVKSIINSHQHVVGASAVQVLELFSICASSHGFNSCHGWFCGNDCMVNGWVWITVCVNHLMWMTSFTTINFPRQWFRMNGWVGMTLNSFNSHPFSQWEWIPPLDRCSQEPLWKNCRQNRKGNSSPTRHLLLVNRMSI